jgi:hypothetical protein
MIAGFFQHLYSEIAECSPQLEQLGFVVRKIDSSSHRIICDENGVAVFGLHGAIVGLAYSS